MSRSTRLFAVLPALVAAGCSCNQDYSFPEPAALTYAEAPPDFGSFLSLDKAPDNRRVTMTYYDRVTSGIGFATGTPQEDGSFTWLHEHVDGYPEEDGLDRGDRGRYTSHLVADDGRVWAAYQDSTNGTLKFAERTAPNVWENEVLDAGLGTSAAEAGYWTSIGVLDGQPIIAHHDRASGLRVAVRGETSWSIETAWEGEDVGRYADLHVQGDTVYIAFYNGTDGNLEMIEGRPGSWSHRVLDSSGDVGQWPDIWADDDELVVAYQHNGDQDLRLIRRSGGNWGDPEVIDDAPYRGADTALFMREGRPAIVYFDGEQNDMLLATQESDGNWSKRQVAGDGHAVGFHNEVVQVNGRVFAASYDHTDQQLFITELFGR